MKWSITTPERNALVETHLGCIWWTINKNRRLISAAGLADEDVFQQLATGCQFAGGGGGLNA